MKRNALLTLLLIFGFLFQLGGTPVVWAAASDPSAPGDPKAPVRIVLPIIFAGNANNPQSEIVPPPSTTTPPPTSTTPAPTTPPPTATTPVPSGYVDIWVFVDADQNGRYSSGDQGLSDVQACLAFGSNDPSCVGTDQGDTWWEDLEAGQYEASVMPGPATAGLRLRSIRCEETISQQLYDGCTADTDFWTTRIDLGATTRINVYYALEELPPTPPPSEGVIDVWAFIDYDQNGVYSAGDDGLSDVWACLTYNGTSQGCSGTDLGDTWWDSRPAGGYEAVMDSTTVPAGMRLRSIRCVPSGGGPEYPGCNYDMNSWTAQIELGQSDTINVFYALEFVTPPNNLVDLWAFIDADQNGIYSMGDTGLTNIRVCLTRFGDLQRCGNTDIGDNWWEFIPTGNYEATIDLTSLPGNLQLNSIRCAESGSRDVEWNGCQYDMNQRTAQFDVRPDTSLYVYFALTFADGQMNHAYVDIWAFVDNDQNGVYSAGDNGLNDAQACLTQSGNSPSCVGTDQGDTWWEDLYAGSYEGSVNPDTIPAGYRLRSIRCQITSSSAEPFNGCSSNLSTWSTQFNLDPATRINVYFALEP